MTEPLHKFSFGKPVFQPRAAGLLLREQWAQEGKNSPESCPFSLHLLFCFRPKTFQECGCSASSAGWLRCPLNTKWPVQASRRTGHSPWDMECCSLLPYTHLWTVWNLLVTPRVSPHRRQLDRCLAAIFSFPRINSCCVITFRSNPNPPQLPCHVISRLPALLQLTYSVWLR